MIVETDIGLPGDIEVDGQRYVPLSEHTAALDEIYLMRTQAALTGQIIDRLLKSKARITKALYFDLSTRASAMGSLARGVLPVVLARQTTSALRAEAMKHVGASLSMTRAEWREQRGIR